MYSNRQAVRIETSDIASITVKISNGRLGPAGPFGRAAFFGFAALAAFFALGDFFALGGFFALGDFLADFRPSGNFIALLNRTLEVALENLGNCFVWLGLANNSPAKIFAAAIDFYRMTFT